jgi:hypothetical protein
MHGRAKNLFKTVSKPASAAVLYENSPYGTTGALPMIPFAGMADKWRWRAMVKIG